jgi:hypothetical protein
VTVNFVCIEIIIKVVLNINVEFGFCTFVAALNYVCIQPWDPTGHRPSSDDREPGWNEES